MKARTKIILIVIAVIITGLGVATSAGSRSSRAEAAAACCCCSGESCPMKKKDVSAKNMAATDDKGACCKDGSCPMKKKDPLAKEAPMSCDTCACCKDDSCPMKKGEHHEMTNMVMKHAEKQHDGAKSCCACCAKHKDGKKPTDAVVDIVTYEL